MLSTLAIAIIVWLAGVAAAEQYGDIVDKTASMALIAFGGWSAVTAWLELRSGSNRHGHHTPELRRLDAEHRSVVTFAEGAGHGHDHHDVHVIEADDGPPDQDELYAPLAIAVAIRHRHCHRHGEKAPPHIHWHDHVAAEPHPPGFPVPLHRHAHRTTGRMALC